MGREIEHWDYIQNKKILIKNSILFEIQLKNVVCFGAAAVGIGRKDKNLPKEKPILTAVVIDTQSLKTTWVSSSGNYFDASNKVKVRKKHIPVETLKLFYDKVIHIFKPIYRR